MSAWYSRSDCNMAECFPERWSWCRNEHVCLENRVNHFERSNGLDTVVNKTIYLPKNYIFNTPYSRRCHVKQKERLGFQVQATVLNRDVTSLLLHVPAT